MKAKYLLLHSSLLILLFVGGCNSSHSNNSGSHKVSGFSSGMSGTNSIQVALVTNDHIIDTITVTGNRQFTFNKTLNNNSSYAVIVLTQPSNETCSVKQPMGAGVQRDITNVEIICSKSAYNIHGVIAGLPKDTKIVLTNNGDITHPLTITKNSSFSFAQKVAKGGTHHILVRQQPTNQSDTSVNISNLNVEPQNTLCSIINPVGVSLDNDTNIQVICSNKHYSIGGSISGLESGQQVTLVNNSDTNHAVTLTQLQDSFTFSQKVAGSGSYNVTITSQPMNEFCTVNRGIGYGVIRNINNIQVVCSQESYIVSALNRSSATGAKIPLINNGDFEHAISIITDESAAFKVANGGNYSIAAITPNGLACSLNGSMGAGVSSNNNGATLICSGQGFTIGGNVMGLDPGEQVTVVSNGMWNNSTEAQNFLILTNNGPYTFTASSSFGTDYNVTISSQPKNKICTVNNHRGSALQTNINNVDIICSNNYFPINILFTTTNLDILSSPLTIVNNSNIDDAITFFAKNESATFNTPVVVDGQYDVTLAHNIQFRSGSCKFKNTSGSIVNKAITVTISCDRYTVSGTVSGLLSGQQVTIVNNNDKTNPIILTPANTAFTFQTAIGTNKYNITIETQPENETCSITNGKGVLASDVTGVKITCSPNTYSVGGSVNGLNLFNGDLKIININTGQQVTLQGMGSNNNFSFSIPFDGDYNIRTEAPLINPPSALSCPVTNESGTQVSRDINNIEVNCSLVQGYTVGGTLNGLSSGQVVSIQLNGNATYQLNLSNAQSSFTFPPEIANGGKYNVTVVSTVPSTLTCTLQNESGTVNNAHVTNVDIHCQ